MNKYQYTIESVTQLNASTKQVILVSPMKSDAVFKAGQYLEIVLPTGRRCPFSIANSPKQSGRIELHIRPSPGSDDSQQIEKLLVTGSKLEIWLPMGNCYIDKTPEKPLVLLAASTGITQMKSILEYLLETDLIHPVFLYWGVLEADDLYLDDQFRNLDNIHSLFHYIPVVSEPINSPGWHGRTGLLADAALADFNELSNLTIYVSGGPAMVYATLDSFTARGMPYQNMHSDIFNLSPRQT